MAPSTSAPSTSAPSTSAPSTSAPSTSNPFNIVTIHGVAQHFYDQENYHKRWERVLHDVAPDLAIRTFGIHWESSGSASYDIAGMLADGVYRRQQVAIVGQQLHHLMPIADMVLAHSLGCSLLMPALMPALMLQQVVYGAPPIIGVGGAIGHPIWGKALSFVGLKWTTAPTMRDYPMPTHFWNDDDPVSSLLGLYLRPEGWLSERLAVAGAAAGNAEHCDEDYLRHPLFLRRLRTSYESRARRPL